LVLGKRGFSKLLRVCGEIRCGFRILDSVFRSKREIFHPGLGEQDQVGKKAGDDDRPPDPCGRSAPVQAGVAVPHSDEPGYFLLADFNRLADGAGVPGKMPAGLSKPGCTLA
jgi:hypothetical protein